MSYRKLLVILSGIWFGLGIVFLSTYTEWKQVSEMNGSKVKSTSAEGGCG